MGKFQTTWTATRLLDFRITHHLTQKNLATLLATKQQRVAEWECGHHDMKRPYSMLLDQLAITLHRLKSQAGDSPIQFQKLVKEHFHVTISGDGL